MPDDLVRAAKRGELCVFVGAGVSVRPPTSLPSFAALVHEMENAHSLKWAEDAGEPPETYLGRLEEAGADIHAAVSKRILEAGGDTNPVHAAVSALAPTLRQVRVVTTNFDRMLELSVEATWGELCTVYAAPALPVGHDFSGLVYLHGRAGDDASTIVITDRDFGRTYITQGWARRFLVQAFSQWTVLFVGYGHDDTVVRYLARGLEGNRSAPRYALCDRSRAEHFRYFGIVPVVFDKSDSEDPYSSMASCLEGWASYVQAKFEDHEKKIKSLVLAGPEDDPEIDTYLRECLLDDELSPVFFANASSLDWLDWLERGELLRQCYDETIVETQPTGLCRWIARSFLGEHAGDLLDRIAGGKPLGPPLWHALTHELAFGDGRPDAPVLGKLIRLLLRSPRVDWRDRLLAGLMSACRLPGDREAVLAILDRVCAPVEQASQSPSLEGEIMVTRPSAEWTLWARAHTLHDAWEAVVQPNIGILARETLDIGLSSLAAIYRLIRIWNGRHEGWDEFSLSRRVIPDSEHDGDRSPTSFIVAVIRDSVDALASQDVESVRAFAQYWIGSDAHLLRRFAVYAIARLESDADAQIQWVLDRCLLHAHGLKNEVYALLAAAWPGATEETRNRLLAANDVNPHEDDEEQLRQSGLYENYNLLVWLDRVDPGRADVASRIETILEQNAFAPRTNPDLDMDVSDVDVYEATGRVRARDAVNAEPEEAADRVLQLLNEDRIDLIGVQIETSARVEREPHWGLGFLRRLAERGDGGAELWDSVFSGWARGAPPDGWLEVTEASLCLGESRDLGGLLSEAASKAEPTSPVLERLASIAETAWSGRVRNDLKEEDPRDWLFRAINASGGKLCQFWLAYGHRVRSLAINEGEAADLGRAEGFFSEVLEESDRDALLARVVLYAKIHVVWWMLPDFAVRRLAPGFDWNASAEEAHRAWSGFLTWGKWNDELLEAMEPGFESVFQNMDRLSDEQQGRLSTYVAGILVLAGDEARAIEVALRFVELAPEEVRSRWMWNVARVAKEADREQRDVWARVCTLWVRRLSGVPRPLAPVDAGWFLLLLDPLGDFADEVLDKLEAGPLPRDVDGIVWAKLLDAERLWAEHGLRIGRFVLQILQAATSPVPGLYHYRKVLERLQTVPGSSDVAGAIGTELRRLSG